jgi:hypothetical protein
MGDLAERLKKPKRKCGECSACCYASEVGTLQKPPYSECPFVLQGAAEGCCSIHKSSPRACKGFKCLWLAGEFRNDQRPDELGVLVSTMRTRFGTIVRVHEAVEDALRDPRVLEFIDGAGLLAKYVTLGLRRSGIVVLGGPAEAVAEYRRAAERDGLVFEAL